MICITDHTTDPYFNLAAEEYLMKSSGKEYFLLWRNEPSIVVGKHQNALAEIDLVYAREKGFKVARRISGGGTVFHDLGNLNFTFISNGEEGKMVNYRKFATPIVEVLSSLGVEATFSNRDDILIKGMKISGNASHVYKKRVLHHGTLLFSSDLTDLAKALKVNPERYTGKAVKSVPSKVTNIDVHLKTDMDVEAFRDAIIRHVLQRFPGAISYAYSADDKQEINRLREDRFATWEWNFGYSPKYVFRKTAAMDMGTMEVEMNVVGGIIEELFIQGDFLRRTETTALEKMLLGVRHDPQYIGETISRNDQFMKEMGIESGNFVKLFI